MSEYAAETSEPVDVAPEPDTSVSDDSAFDTSDGSWEADYPEQGDDTGGPDNPVLEDDWADEEVVEQSLPDLPDDSPSDWAEGEIVDVQSDSSADDPVENPVLADEWDDEESVAEQPLPDLAGETQPTEVEQPLPDLPSESPAADGDGAENPVLADDWNDEPDLSASGSDSADDPSVEELTEAAQAEAKPISELKDEYDAAVTEQLSDSPVDPVENPVLADDWDDEESVAEQPLPDLHEESQPTDVEQPLPDLPTEPATSSETSGDEIENPVLADDFQDEDLTAEQPLPDLQEAPDAPLPDLPEAAPTASETGGDEIENPVLADDFQEEDLTAEQPLPDLPEETQSAEVEQQLPEVPDTSVAGTPEAPLSDIADNQLSDGQTDSPNEVASAAFGEASHKTDVGSAFFNANDDAYSATGDVPKYDGEYVVDIHGTPDSVGVLDPNGAWHEMTAQQFAGELKKTGWDGKEPIRLFSCDTGKDPNGFAQQLADELGVKVTAPTEPVWSSKNGEPFVTAIGEDGMPVKPPTGTWVEFEPSGTKGA